MEKDGIPMKRFDESESEGEDQFIEESEKRSADTLKASGPSSSKKNDYKLSVTSAKYDRGGKGFLDDTEKKLRELDTDNTGALDLDKVYGIMNNLQGEQRKTATLKSTVIVLTVFAMLLAVSNIGTSFAAARMAKDTSVDGATMSLTDKKTGERLATANKITIGEDGLVINVVEDVRMLQTAVGADLKFKKSWVEQMYRDICSNYAWGNDANCVDGSDRSLRNINDYLHIFTLNGLKPVTTGDTKVFNVFGARSTYLYGMVSFTCTLTSADCTASESLRQGLGEACACGGKAWVCPENQECSYCTGDTAANGCKTKGQSTCTICTTGSQAIENEICCDGSPADCCPATNTPQDIRKVCQILYTFCDDERTCIPRVNYNIYNQSVDPVFGQYRFVPDDNMSAWFNNVGQNPNIECFLLKSTPAGFNQSGCASPSTRQRDLGNEVAKFVWNTAQNSLTLRMVGNETSNPFEFEEWGFWISQKKPLAENLPYTGYLPGPLLGHSIIVGPNAGREAPGVFLSKLPEHLRNQSGGFDGIKPIAYAPCNQLSCPSRQPNNARTSSISGTRREIIQNNFWNFSTSDFSYFQNPNYYQFIAWANVCKAEIV